MNCNIMLTYDSASELNILSVSTTTSAAVNYMGIPNRPFTFSHLADAFIQCDLQLGVNGNKWE